LTLKQSYQITKNPSLSGELSQTQLTQALSWYAQNRDSKDAIKYATEYFKKKLKIQAPEGLKSQPSTFGFICRIVSLGGVLNESNATWFR
jgi:hypothetical protein